MDIRQSYRRILNSLPSLAVLAALAAFALPSSAFAAGVTAFNTQISNTATLNYNDGGNVPQLALTSTVFVTVSLVEAPPLLTSNSYATTVQQGGAVSYTYTIISQANGVDTYTESLNQNTNNGIVSAYSPVGGIFSSTSIQLGATDVAVAALSGATTFQVPCDFVGGVWNAGGNIVNGFDTGANSSIVILGHTYTISGISRTNCGTAPNQNVVITISTAGGLVGAVPANTQAGELLTFTWGFTHAGTVSPATSAGQYNIEVKAVAGANTTIQGGGAGTSTVITVDSPAVGIIKYIWNGSAWSTSPPNANPGATLIYLIAITNTGLGNATAAAITDTLPSYVTYVPGSAKYGTTAVGTITYGTGTSMLDTLDTHGYSFTAPGSIAYSPVVSGGSPSATIGPSGFLDLMLEATIN